MLSALLRLLWRRMHPTSPTDRALTRREIRRIDRAADWDAYERELNP